MTTFSSLKAEGKQPAFTPTSEEVNGVLQQGSRVLWTRLPSLHLGSPDVEPRTTKNQGYSVLGNHHKCTQSGEQFSGCRNSETLVTPGSGCCGVPARTPFSSEEPIHLASLGLPAEALPRNCPWPMELLHPRQTLSKQSPAPNDQSM